MSENSGYFVVKKKALPEVLLKVVETQALLRTGKAATIQEAVDRTGISRSSFYKYKDDIFPFHDSTEGKTLTFTCEMEDEPGILSDVLKIIADFGANVLTIHQSIPINGIATLTLSVNILPAEGDAETMMEEIEKKAGVHYLNILGRE